jgi:4-hydroxymandelate oxidase
VTPEELARAAQAVLPADVYAYVASGAGAQTTLAANDAAWAALAFRPRALAAAGPPDTRTTLLGTAVATPIGVAPTASHALLSPEAEPGTARGAREAGSLYVLSTRSSTPLEEVAAHAGPWWFQLYALRDAGLTRELAVRAAAAGAGALVLTGDTPVLGRRERGSGTRLLPPGRGPLAVLGRDVDVRAELLEQDPHVGWDAVGRLAEASGLPVVVKGVLRADDAQQARSAGAAAVVVSNHGGRQLDGAVATARALPEVVDTVGGDLEVYVDGGLRRGTDVLRALALGARAVLVGRPVLWALATGGGDGVRELLTGLTAELALALQLAGCPDVAVVPRDLVLPS